MLNSEFTPEMGALIRSLESKVRLYPNLRHEDLNEALDHLEQAIVILCALHINLKGTNLEAQ